MIKLSNFEIQSLFNEIVGGEKIGLLNEELKFTVKNKLENLKLDFASKLKTYTEAEKALFLKFGAKETENGGISLEFATLEKEQVEEFIKERTELAEVTYDFNIEPFDESLITFTSKSNYPIFGKHLIKQ